MYLVLFPNNTCWIRAKCIVYLFFKVFFGHLISYHCKYSIVYLKGNWNVFNPVVNLFCLTVYKLFAIDVNIFFYTNIQNFIFSMLKNHYSMVECSCMQRLKCCHTYHTKWDTNGWNMNNVAMYILFVWFRAHVLAFASTRI